MYAVQKDMQYGEGWREIAKAQTEDEAKTELLFEKAKDPNGRYRIIPV